MLKHLMKWRVAAFEKRYEYDASYLRELAESDPRALMAFAKMQGMSRYRGGLPTAAWFAAKIVGAMYEDCGPCTQLVVRMAEEAGVDGATLRALVGGHDAALTEELRDVVAFARASLAHDPADEERDARDRPEEDGHRPRLLLGLLEHLGLRPDHEVVLLAGRLVDPVALAEEGRDLVLGLGDHVGVRDGGHDHPDRRRPHDLLADRLIGSLRKIV